MAQKSLREALGEFPPNYFAEITLERDIAKFGSVAKVRRVSMNGAAYFAVEPDASDESVAAEIIKAICQNRPLIVKINGHWRAVKLESWDGCFD